MVQLVFLSTPSARRATGESYHRGCRRDISIHALREEGDTTARIRGSRSRISIHALRAGGGRRQRVEIYPYLAHFYPRPPRGGRPFFPAIIDIVKSISIHALREEGDFAVRDLHLANIQFLSTPSARRATLRRVCSPSTSPRISIHALREEGDEQLYVGQGAAARSFLSTPSARRATISQPRARMEGCNFYPRPPRGGRPFPNLAPVWRLQFLSTPSARRATLSVPVANRGINDFYPRPPRGW